MARSRKRVGADEKRSHSLTSGTGGAEPLWRQLEKRAISAYRALGFEVVHDINIGGKQTDLLCSRYIAGAGQVVLYVDCKFTTKKSIRNDEVDKFVNCFDARRHGEGWTKGVMVSNRPFSQFAKSTVQNRPEIVLQTIEELEADGFRYPSYVDYVLRKSATDPVLNEYYVPLQATSFDPSTGRTGPRRDLLSQVTSWLSSDSSQLWIMGDFGSGKTTFLEWLHSRMARDWKNGEQGRMALLIPLRQYDRASSHTALAREICHRELNPDIPPRTFETFVREGRFLFLFDGFDEMARASDENVRHHLYSTLMRAALGSKSIVTCRPGFFVGATELRELLDSVRAEAAPGILESPDACARARSQGKASQTLSDALQTDYESVILTASGIARTASALQISLLNDNQIDEF